MALREDRCPECDDTLRVPTFPGAIHIGSVHTSPCPICCDDEDFNDWHREEYPDWAL